LASAGATLAPAARPAIILLRIPCVAATLAPVTRVSLSALLGLALWGAAATSFAQVDARSVQPGATPGAAATRDAREARGEGETEQQRLPWRGSTFLFDQSVTAQTVGIGKDYQSRDDVYELWFAFKPRYTFFERGKEALTLHLWMNLYLELTNSDTTTTQHEPVIGPTTLWGLYTYTFHEHAGYRTAASIGPRMIFPTDRASRNAGQLFGLGAMAAATQTVPLAPETARAFTSL